MSDMSNLYRAYSAVHSTEIKEELTQNRDQISEMNLSGMVQSDLVEVCEEIVEGLFQYGLSLGEACDAVASVLEECVGGERNELRGGKITQIAEAFETVVDTVTTKAERNCEEEFLLYRKNKPLTEKWNGKVSHEFGNEKLHASLISEDRHQLKFGLIEMISKVLEAMKHREADTGKVVDKAEVGKTYYPHGERQKSSVALRKEKEKKVEEEVSTLRQGWGSAYSAIYEKKLDPVGQEDGDVDNDGDEDSSDKYLAKRRKAISKSMGKKEKTEEGYMPMTPERTARVNKAKAKAFGKEQSAVSGGDEKEANKQMQRRVAMSDPKGRKNQLMNKEEVTFSEAELEAIQSKVDSWED